jgi:hypothetical protein
MILIEGIPLLQINIEGECMPPKASILEIIEGIKNKDTARQFAKISNKTTAHLDKQYNPYKYIDKSIDDIELERLNYYIQIFLIEYRQISIIGIELYPQFVQLNFLYSWYLSVMGGFNGGDMKKIKDGLSHMLKVLKGNTSYTPLKKNQTVQHYSKLDKYPGYVLARDFIEEVEKEIAVIAMTNRELAILQIRKLELIKNSAAFSVKNNIEISYKAFCPYCEKYFTSTQKRSPKSCGSPECEAKYSTSKNPSTYQRTDWVLDLAVRPKLCIGQCASRQKGLNNQRYCRDCWEKSSIL